MESYVSSQLEAADLWALRAEIGQRRSGRGDRTRGVPQPVTADKQPQGATSDQGRGERVFPGGSRQTIHEASL